MPQRSRPGRPARAPRPARRGSCDACRVEVSVAHFIPPCDPGKESVSRWTDASVGIAAVALRPCASPTRADPPRGRSSDERPRRLGRVGRHPRDALRRAPGGEAGGRAVQADRAADHRRGDPRGDRDRLVGARPRRAGRDPRGVLRARGRVPALLGRARDTAQRPPRRRLGGTADGRARRRRARSPPGSRSRSLRESRRTRACSSERRSSPRASASPLPSSSSSGSSRRAGRARSSAQRSSTTSSR